MNKEPMYSKICDIIEDSFEREDFTYRQYSSKDGTSLSDALEKVFEEAGFDTANYDIVSNTIFSCPSTDFGYVSVSWIEDNRLLHVVFDYTNK